jgi:putative ABC transport system permease protein
MHHSPPKWADRFLQWYCNPELLEEIQGDAHELYFERLNTHGKRFADRKYFLDIIRFFRWSNIKRSSSETSLKDVAQQWRFNFKLAARNASRNKLIFIIKTLGLAICFAFTLLLTAFIINEARFDFFHTHHERIFRVVSKVKFKDRETNYAVTPLPIGRTLQDGVPEIEKYFRFIYYERPVLTIDEEQFVSKGTLVADSNFLKVLSLDFIAGSNTALDEPNSIVLTESLTRKLFGKVDVIGETLEFGDDLPLQVTGVIKDIPSNSHLQFDALVSWDTFDRDDTWENLNAYTYILLKPGARIEEVAQKSISTLSSFQPEIVQGFEAAFEPKFEKITAIHFSEGLDEDVAEKRNYSTQIILIAVVILFILTGLINYLNLTLTELTAHLKKIGVIRIFGGASRSHYKITFSDSVFSILIVVPLLIGIFFLGWNSARDYLSISINPNVLFDPVFISAVIGFLFAILASSRVNAFILTRAASPVNSLKGNITAKDSGSAVRKTLVSIQLSFSMVMIALIIVIVDQFEFIQNSDKGFDASSTIVLKLRTDDHLRIESLNEELMKIPGIIKADASSYFPDVIETKYVFQIETKTGMQQVLVPMNRCGYDYMDILKFKVVQGRTFQRSHSEDTYGAFVINETAAKEFGWENPVGKKIRGPLLGSNDDAYNEGEVIGVVKDFNYATLHTKIEPMIFFMTDQRWGGQFIYIKTDPIHPHDLIARIEQKFKSSLPDQPFEWEYLDSTYQSLYRADEQVKNIFEIGLIVSIVISCLGIFSVSAFLIMLRTREMSIRKVVGANPIQLFVLHSKAFFQFGVVAVLIGSPFIWYLSTVWLQNFAYHINLSVWYFVLPGIIMFIVTLITIGYHGIKSSRVNLVEALKYE